jgi:hypothetical protein
VAVLKEYLRQWHFDRKQKILADFMKKNQPFLFGI